LIKEWKETIRTSIYFNGGTHYAKKPILSANGGNQVNIRGKNVHEESEQDRGE